MSTDREWAHVCELLIDPERLIGEEGAQAYSDPDR
jgi:polyhydroxyalkanoate synthesis regulator phasin